MAALRNTQITVRRLTGAIDADVLAVNLRQPLDDETFAMLHFYR